MDELALLLWVVTIGGGSLLAALWLRHGGAKQAPDAQRPPSTGPGAATTTMARPQSKIALSLIVPHASLGIVGAITWMLYRANPDDTSYEPIRWLALALLLGTISLGFVMFGRWLADRREAGRGAEAGDGPPERHLPLLVVVLHGLGAAATLVFVVLALVA